jgi:hypothetical protein
MYKFITNAAGINLRWACLFNLYVVEGGGTATIALSILLLMDSTIPPNQDVSIWKL